VGIPWLAMMYQKVTASSQTFKGGSGGQALSPPSPWVFVFSRLQESPGRKKGMAEKNPGKNFVCRKVI